MKKDPIYCTKNFTKMLNGFTKHKTLTQLVLTFCVIVQSVLFWLLVGCNREGWQLNLLVTVFAMAIGASIWVLVSLQSVIEEYCGFIQAVDQRMRELRGNETDK